MRVSEALLILATGVALLCISFGAYGASQLSRTDVYAVMMDEQLAGMAYVDIPLNLSCKRTNGTEKGWVTLSTDGQHISPVVGHENYRQAQMAMAKGVQVAVLITDGRKRNGFCLATRTTLSF